MRDRFHVPDHYFLTHSVGAQPKSSLAYTEDLFFRPWQTKGGAAWPEWMDWLMQFRVNLAHFLGTKAANVCPQTNVSSALTKILFGLPFRTGRKTIVLSQQDFPTIGFVLKQAETMGYRLRFIDGDAADINLWAEALGDDVALVHITHVTSNTSQRLPVRDICALARKHGIISIVDIAQSVGVIPIDLAAWQADFVIGTSVKFLCGGPGACFMVASDAMIKACKPIDVGWFSHENPFEMDINNFRYAKDAMKFFGGTPSPAPFITAVNAINIWNDIGIKSVYDSVQDKLDQLVKSVPDDVLVSPRQRQARGGTLVLNPENRDAFKSKVQAFTEFFDVRKEGFRLSVHAYTGDDEIDALRKIIKTVF